MYRVFISLLDARVFASMFSKLSSKLYRNVLVERLSSHIDTEPGEKFTWLINHTASDKSLKERCTAQIIVVNDFYDCLATMRQLNHKPKLKFESFNITFHVEYKNTCLVPSPGDTFAGKPNVFELNITYAIIK